MVDHYCLVLEELREPGPLEVVLGVGSGVMGVRKGSREAGDTYLPGALEANSISCQTTANS